MKKYLALLGLAFSLFCPISPLAIISPASAVVCNDPGGFIKSFGPITLGNALILSPDCQHASDGGTSVGSFSVTPQARITIVPGTAVVTTNTLGATSVCVTPSGGNSMPLTLDGSTFSSVQFSEYCQALSNTTKSPAATVAGQAYDVFCWSDAPVTCSRGAARAQNTIAPVTFINGLPTNTSAITNGPAANRGTYIGSFVTDGSNLVNLNFGTSAAGGGTASIQIWNMWNRAFATANVFDTNSAVPFNFGAGVWGVLNNNAVNILHGLDLDAVEVQGFATIGGTATDGAYISIGLDAVVSPNCAPSSFGYININASVVTSFNCFMGFGYHRFNLIGRNTGVTAVTSGGISPQIGITAKFLW